MIKGHLPDKMVHYFAAPSHSVNTDLGYHLRLEQEPILSMIHRYLWQARKLFFFFFNTLRRQTSYSAHHTSLDLSRRLSLLTITVLVIASAIFSRNCQTSPCDSHNIFFPPLSVTSQVVRLLPAVSDCRHEPCLHPLLVCVHMGHIDLLLLDQRKHHRNGFTNVM